jgi:hypothetical protein
MSKCFAFYKETAKGAEFVENLTENEARKLYNKATKTLEAGELAGYAQMNQNLLSYKVLKNKYS